MKRLLLILFILPQLLSAKVNVTNPKTEGLVNPLGIDAVNPRFSWQITSDKKEVVQTAYQIVVSSDGKELRKGNFRPAALGTLSRYGTEEQSALYVAGESLHEQRCIGLERAPAVLHGIAE